jgi:hypothetical protein
MIVFTSRFYFGGPVELLDFVITAEFVGKNPLRSPRTAQFFLANSANPQRPLR